MNKKIVNVLKYIIFLSLGVGLFIYLYNQQNAAYQVMCGMTGIPSNECSFLDKIVDDFRSANFFWIGMVWLAFFVSNLGRAWRWNMLLEPLGFRTKTINAFFSIMFGYFVNLGFPRAGEFARAGMISKYENADYSKVMGTIITDRIIDVFSLLIVIGITFLLDFKVIWGAVSPGLSKMDPTFYMMLLLAGVIGIAVFIYFWKTDKLKNIPVLGKIMSILKELFEGVLSIRKVKNLPKFLFFSVLIWAMYYIMIVFALKAVGTTEHLGLLPALMVFVFGTLGFVMPVPGGIGAYHALVMQALALYGLSSIDGFSFANIVFFSIQLLANISFGVAAIIILPIINKKKNKEPILSS